jgi:hypothetical protein
MSKIEVNAIEPQCGTTLTLGASGDTVSLPSGVTLSGVGTVSWDTTAKTASFTAVSGNGYFINTTSGTITLTLPASPSAGDIVAFKDYANTFQTNNLTIARNGSPIGGTAADAVISVEGQAVTMVYVDATQGWLSTYAATESDLPKPLFTIATGGTITCCGDYKIHTFTGPGTFCVSQVGNASGGPSNVDYLVVAGGGSATFAGGGGAGGYRESSGAASGCYTRSPLGACVSALPITVQGYSVTVGAGGAGTAKPNAPEGTPGNNGSNSVFSTITSAGGGWGGVATPTVPNANSGNSGGSGGGGGAERSPTSNKGLCGSAGNTPPVSPPQGNPGGKGSYDGPSHTAGGGGGGSGAAGGNSPGNNAPNTCTPGGTGGTGVGTAINPRPSYGTPGPSAPLRYFAGGGRGGTNNGVPVPEKAGSVGGGGSGGAGGGENGTNGTTNTGGGAGGGAEFAGTNTSGGSGIVIIRYKFQ